MRDLGAKPPPNFIIFSTRVFFVRISKSQYSMLFTIFRFLRIHVPNMDSFPMLFSHPTQPPVRPSWITGYQTGSCSSISQFTGYQTGSCSSISQFKTESRWPVSSISQFTGYQNGSFSSISRFKTELKRFLFQYFQFPKLFQHYLFQELIYFSPDFSFSTDYTAKYSWQYMF